MMNKFVAANISQQMKVYHHDVNIDWDQSHQLLPATSGKPMVPICELEGQGSI